MSQMIIINPFGPDIIPPVREEREIVAFLANHGTPLHTWHEEKGYRSIFDFVDHMTKDKFYFRGDTIDGKLVINVHVAVVIVQFVDNGRLMEIYEASQEFQSGIEVTRDFRGVGETLRRGEDPHAGAVRCLDEELGFKNPALYEIDPCHRVERKDPKMSEKWPGIFACYHRFIFNCVISKELYRPEGYIEEHKRRRVHFKWKPAPEVQNSSDAQGAED